MGISEEEARCEGNSLNNLEGKGLSERAESLKSERGWRRASGRNGGFSEHLLCACQACDGKDMQRSSAVKERKLEAMPSGSK